MAKFMKMLNNISRSQAIFRREKILNADLLSGHYAYALAICHTPGHSQEELAQELCVNKSSVTRNLNQLEEKGYIIRKPLSSDKRQFSIFPTDKMQDVLPKIKQASAEWMQLLSDGIPQDELEIFNSVLARMEARAREIIKEQENK